MNISKDKIWDTYFFDENEISTFRYIKKYNSLILPKKAEILKDEKKIMKFSLVGLFPIYRMCNHWGTIISSSKSSEFKTPIYKERLALIEDIIGEKLIDTDHYLKLLNFSTIKLINPFYPLHRKLYKSVMYP